MLTPARSYDALYGSFRWALPARFNIAVACCDRWAAAEPDRPALIKAHVDGSTTPISYGSLKRDADRLAFALTVRGVGREDRVAVLLPQGPEAAFTHFAAYKIGAIVVPLAALFGADALRFRLETSGARVVVTDGFGLAKLAPILADLPDVETVLCVDGSSGPAEGLRETMEAFKGPYNAIATGVDDPALMIFTSGTTGQPKGALHAHRVLLGHLPGFQMSHEFFPEAGDRMWTPSDWAWAGGLLNGLLPSLYFGVPVVYGPFQRFDPEAAYALMAKCGVRNAFLPPTALRLLRAVREPRARFDLRLRTVVAAGESLGRDTYEWARSALGLTVNEVYGQTECNYVLASSVALGISRAGAIGKPVPGHEVAIIDREGMPVRTGDIGQIAIRTGDPVMFLEYWKDARGTREKFLNGWMVTGDQGVEDEDGYVRFVGRDDDIIISSGYRIGPSEIEDCLVSHPAVALAAAVGKPDRIRNEVVKAYVVLRPGFTPSDDLAAEIQQFVRTRLSATEYPREVDFVGEIPLTTTGKVIRSGLREQARDEAATELARDGEGEVL
ncbi:MAG TPA: AMP-binding protein [Bauldia sp.]|nr:AMP-binding protein [Bauldia sp.]